MYVSEACLVGELSCSNDAQHWRSDGHKWFNSARMDMPKGNPVVTKIYFNLETEQGVKKEFRKQVSSKMNSSLGFCRLLTLYWEWKSVSIIGFDQQNNNRD